VGEGLTVVMLSNCFVGVGILAMCTRDSRLVRYIP
jgi:hypothetical protein